MGMLDRFRSKSPPKNTSGGSGRAHYGGFIQREELNPELTGAAGLKVFDRMYRTDPDVRRVMWMAYAPILGGTWGAEPYGGDNATDKDKEAAEFIDWLFFEHLTPDLAGHLDEALPVLMRSGFAPFEIPWEVTKWKGRDVIVPRSLELRLPRTIERWEQEGGRLTAIEQWLPTGVRAKMAAEDLVYYRVGAEGDNWEGTSLLRPAYKPWFLKDKLERIDVIAAEREATGVPIAYPPRSEMDDEVLEKVEEILGGMRTNESGYIVAPGPAAQFLKEGDGWHFDILSHKSSESRDLSKSLEYHRNGIAAAFIAEFMRLGQDGTGARATADIQQNPFLAAVESIANIPETVLNRSIVARAYALNFEGDRPPKLSMSLVDSTSLEQLADFTQKLVQAEALQPDAPLEDYLRERADMPPADPDERKAREEARKSAREALAAGNGPSDPNDPPGNDPPKPGDPPPEPKPPAKKPPAKPAPKTDPDDSPQWSRDLRSWEQLMCLEEVDNAITGARTSFEDVAGPEARRIASEFAKAALAGKKQPKVGDDLREVLERELGNLYRLGRRTVADELDRQRSPVPSTPTAFDGDEKSEKNARDRIRRRAQIAADSIISRIWQSVSRAVIQRVGDEANAQSAGEIEAGAALRAEAQLHAAGSLNEGRSDQGDLQADEIRGARYTSILDANRCAACSTADDDVLRPLDDPIRLAHKPPNPDCHGGGRCRCMEFFELDEESPGHGGGPPPSQPPSAPPSPGGDPQDHFRIQGGSQAARDLVSQQIDAIASVHGFPAGLPQIDLKITRLSPGSLGHIESGFDPVTGTWAVQIIRLQRSALTNTPPMPSAVHEIGHYLDQWGFGDGPPTLQAARMGEWASSTDALREWRTLVTNSRAYSGLRSSLAAASAGTDAQLVAHLEYLLRDRELFARSYEQWIATRSNDPVLLGKITERRASRSATYWDVADFEPIAEAMDRIFRSRGLMR